MAWHENGQKKSEENFIGRQDGLGYLLRGMKTERFQELQGNYKDGKPSDGLWKSWHENGH